MVRTAIWLCVIFSSCSELQAASEPSVEIELVGISPRVRRTTESCKLVFRLVNRSPHALVLRVHGGDADDGVDVSLPVERIVLWPEELDQPQRVYPGSGVGFLERALSWHVFSELTLVPGQSTTFAEYLVDIPKGSGILIPFHYEWEGQSRGPEPYHFVVFDRRNIDRKKLPKECLTAE